MGANSALRKVAKTILYPVTNEKTYMYAQAVSKAWDIKKGTWDEPELDLLELGLKKGSTTLDIGANFGIYAHYMSKAVGKKGKVYSFEPVPFTYQTLKVVAKLLRFAHNVEMIEKGCSNENSTIQFTVPTQESGAYSAGQAYIGGRDDDREGKEKQVRWTGTKDVEAEVIRLDDYLPEINDLPLIKADIEGAELFCFRGAEKIIEKHLPTTICEINPWFLEGFGINLEQLTEFFTGRGYRIFHYSNSPAKILKEVQVNEIVEDNYVFLHDTRAEEYSSLLR